ncbi:MAG: hypothetical protein ACK448_01520, partial [Bacteroidota bacterium]
MTSNTGLVELCCICLPHTNMGVMAIYTSEIKIWIVRFLVFVGFNKTSALLESLRVASHYKSLRAVCFWHKNSKHRI